MGLVPVPADADPDIVFSAKNLPNPSCGATERFDLRDDLVQPGRDRFGPLQLPQGVVVSEPKRSDPPLPLELPELKGLERKVPDPGNKSLFSYQRNKVGGLAQPFRLRSRTFKQCELLRHARRSFRVASLLHVGFQYAAERSSAEDGNAHAASNSGTCLRVKRRHTESRQRGRPW